MRALAVLSLAVVCISCKKAETPAADTTAPVAAAVPAPPPPIALADVAGKWNTNVMGETGDSVLTTYVMTATADTTGWSFQFPKGKAIPLQVVSVAGDSIVNHAGPFPSSVRPGMTVTTDIVSRLQDGKLVSRTVGHYVTKGEDSVRVFRSVGTRAQ